MKLLFRYSYLIRTIFLAMLMAIPYGSAFADEGSLTETPGKTNVEGADNKTSGSEKIKLLNEDIKKIENKLDCCIKKLKLMKGEFNLSDNESKDTSILSQILPDKIQWKIESKLKSNFLNGDLDIGEHFTIRGNLGHKSGIKALLVFPF